MNRLIPLALICAGVCLGALVGRLTAAPPLAWGHASLAATEAGGPGACDWIDDLNKGKPSAPAGPSSPGAPAAPTPDARRFKVAMIYEITAPGKTINLKMRVPVPRSQVDRQDVKVTYSPAPSRTWEKNANAFAEFSFPQPQPFTRVVVNVDATLYGYDLAAAQAAARPSLYKGPGYQEYYKHERYIERDSTTIRSMAEALPGSKDFSAPDQLDTVHQIFDFVSQHISYRIRDERIGAEAVAVGKVGDCTEFTDLFVALCRAKNIPARPISGIVLDRDDGFHAWAEVYLKDYGWVPFDPTFANRLVEPFRGRAFRDLRPIYLYTSVVDYGDVLAKGGAVEWQWLGDEVRVTRKVQVLN